MELDVIPESAVGLIFACSRPALPPFAINTLRHTREARHHTRDSCGYMIHMFDLRLSALPTLAMHLHYYCSINTTTFCDCDVVPIFLKTRQDWPVQPSIPVKAGSVLGYHIKLQRTLVFSKTGVPPVLKTIWFNVGPELLG